MVRQPMPPYRANGVAVPDGLTIFLLSRSRPSRPRDLAKELERRCAGVWWTVSGNCSMPMAIPGATAAKNRDHGELVDRGWRRRQAEGRTIHGLDVTEVVLPSEGGVYASCRRRAAGWRR